jgi:Cu2+-exporting ATPase
MTVTAENLHEGDTAVRAACAHCGLPVPLSRLRTTAEHHFCCNGCEAVWNILHNSNLTEYYGLRNAYAETEPHAARVSGKSFAYLDDPEFIKKFGRPRVGGGVAVQFYLEGVHCIACSWLVEKVLLEREGARFARLDLGKSTLEVIFNPATTKLSRIAEALDHIGYTPHAIVDDEAAMAQRKETRTLLARMGIAAASAMNILLLSISQYAGDRTGIEAGYSALFRWVSLGLALPAVLYSAWPYYRGAWSGLRRRVLHMDLPISLGIAVSFMISAAATIRNRGDVYFDSVCMLIFLLLTGRLLLQRAGRRAADAGIQLLSLTPRVAHRIEDDNASDVLLTDVIAGDTLRVLPGETVPVDGSLESAGASIQEAHLTGEFLPVMKTRGEILYAGSVVEQYPVEMTAIAVGETTRLGRLAAMMLEASQRRAPIVALMDRIAGYFVGGVLLLSAATAVVWYFLDPARMLWNVAALLVVACPCALGLATPVALAVAMGKAARRGIFIKGQDGIERLASVEHVILDKTGTVTDGKLSIVESCFADLDLGNTILRHVAALERVSGHAIASAFDDIECRDVRVEASASIAGAGIEGRADGIKYAIGSETFVTERGCGIPEALANFAKEKQDSGLTFVWIARDSQVVAVAGLCDNLRSDALSAVAEMRSMDLELELLSGDGEQAVRHVAESLNITEYAGQTSPENKLKRVESLLASHLHVAMVGDGVNDAAALSRATVGISAANSADVARDAADVFISTDRGPSAIADALRLSRRAMKIIRLNLGIALAYNLVGAGLAMTGHVGPLAAAVLMPLSSLTVLLIASRA